VPAYIVALVEIKDRVKYKGYDDAWNFESFTNDYGGEFLMISDEPEVIEGEWSGRLVVMKFPDAEKARAWYDSPEYHDVRKIRWAAATSNLSLHPGFDVEAALARRDAGLAAT
jgi:uncharacterized protein (DUF1330 family)